MGRAYAPAWNQAGYQVDWRVRARTPFTAKRVIITPALPSLRDRLDRKKEVVLQSATSYQRHSGTGRQGKGAQRHLVAGSKLSCSGLYARIFAWSTNEDSCRSARQPGQSRQRLIAPLIRRRAITGYWRLESISPVRKRSTNHKLLLTSLPIPSRHIGNAPPPALPCPAPACLINNNIPALISAHHVSPDLRHGAS